MEELEESKYVDKFHRKEFKKKKMFSLFSPVSQQADLALQEAIRIAQESNDHVCLQHCLVQQFPLHYLHFSGCAMMDC